MNGAVTLLLAALLGHPSFAVRERTTAHLFRNESCIVFVTPLTFHPDPEVAARATRIVAWHNQHWDRLAAECCGPFPIPWIDALHPSYRDRNMILREYVARAQAEGTWTDPDGGPYVFGAWRRATYLWVRDELRGGRDVEDMKAAVRMLRVRCQGWNGVGPLPCDVQEDER